MSFLGDVDPFSETPLEVDVTHTECNLIGNLVDDDEDKPKLPKQLPYALPLTPEEVRWMFRDENKIWIEFCGYDSLRIENAYRVIHDSSNESDNDNDSNEGVKIVVRGGLYEVDLDKKKCFSIYWPGEEWEITRGIWFYEGTWTPLDADGIEYSDDIEKAHLKMFQKQSLTQSSSTPDLGTPTHSYKVLHTVHFTQHHVDWHAINDVLIHSEYTPTKLMRSVTSKFGFTKSTGYRLRRGYKELANADDKPDDIDHLVFVVHGIGQKGDVEKIIRNTSMLRECVDRMQQKYFPSSLHRVEFFPVEWRSSLKLDGDIVDAITLDSVKAIRNILNTSAMDILYYSSPLYGIEVRAGLQKELNRLYQEFMKRHPGWQGKVSILAHSLGCVIVYDIVTGWVGFETRTPGGLEQSSKGLNFPIEHLFCLGSPLSVFLALRTCTPSNKLDLMPDYLCKKFYNIFHWSDPVAYRMEPLLERGYSKLKPIGIPSHGGVDSLIDPQVQPPFGNGDQSNSQTEIDEKEEIPSPTDTPSKGWSLKGLIGQARWNKNDGTSPTQDDPPIQPDQELPQRLDYVLKGAAMVPELLQCVYSVTAHTAYWTNCDVAYFVLTRIFPSLEA